MKGVKYMNRRVFVLGIMLAVCLLAGCSSGKTEGTQESDVREVPAAIVDIATTQSFTEEAVSAEDMETILLAGINAPSAMNGQPWHFSAVTDSALLEQIAEDMSAGRPGMSPAGGGSGAGTPGMSPAGADADVGMPEAPPAATDTSTKIPGTPPAAGGAKAGIADAPLAIVVSCRNGSELDAGLACQTMSVAAILMGYGTKIVTSPTIALNGVRQEQYRELLGIPEDYAAAAVLLIGHAADISDAATSATVRNSMDEVVSRVAP